MSGKSVLTFRLNSWLQARALADALQGWSFRGQQEASWPLNSALQRAAEEEQSTTVLLTGIEEEMIEEFQRKAHHFVTDPPPAGNLIDWMALIQHFGGPTRLLDFTKSFYVAAFFAVERASGESAIWCVNHYELLLGLEKFLNLHTIKSTLPRWQVLHRTGAAVQEILRQNKISFQKAIFEVQPFKLNERLVIQQGLFLCPLSIGISFMDSLAETLGLAPTAFANSGVQDLGAFSDIERLRKEAAVVKLLIPRSIQHDVLQDLWNMNVNAATLFPGLDGLARSLHYHARIQNLWDVKYKAGGFEKKRPAEGDL